MVCSHSGAEVSVGSGTSGLERKLPALEAADRPLREPMCRLRICPAAAAPREAHWQPPAPSAPRHTRGPGAMGSRERAGARHPPCTHSHHCTQILLETQGVTGPAATPAARNRAVLSLGSMSMSLHGLTLVGSEGTSRSRCQPGTARDHKASDGHLLYCQGGQWGTEGGETQKIPHEQDKRNRPCGTGKPKSSQGPADAPGAQHGLDFASSTVAA